METQEEIALLRAENSDLRNQLDRAQARIRELEAWLLAEKGHWTEELAKTETRIAELEEQATSLVAEKGHWTEELAKTETRIAELEERVRKDSHNSSRPPSSDGLRRRPRTRSQRTRSGKPSGGQKDHVGANRPLAPTPDTIEVHRPHHCSRCECSLEGVEGKVVERRQVHDLPPMRVLVCEHRVEEVCCPNCQKASRGHFPQSARGPVQYGPRVRALAVCLHQYEFVASERTCAFMAEAFGCPISEGTLTNWVQTASRTLAPTVAQIKQWLIGGRLLHGDETGVRLGGKLHWLHVACTRWLTHLDWHPRRGRDGMDAIGIWPHFRGRAMRDRWASYDGYCCAQSICGAHLLRDLTAVYEQDQERQQWAEDLRKQLIAACHATNVWRDRGATSLPKHERDEYVARYFEILYQPASKETISIPLVVARESCLSERRLVLGLGLAAQPPPPPEPPPKDPPPTPPVKRRRRATKPKTYAQEQRLDRDPPKKKQKRSAAQNLLDALFERAPAVLAFLDDLSLPFTNNQAERDFRMVKVHQKVAGTFRSEEGITAFCRIRSYLSTMQKQGHRILEALAAVFEGHPLPIACSF